MVQLIYAQYEHWWSRLLTNLMFMSPSITFDGMMMTVMIHAGMILTMQDLLNEKQKGLKWKDYFIPWEGNLFSTKGLPKFYIPSLHESLQILMLYVIGFLILLWIADNIFVSNRGFSRNPLFFVYQFYIWIKDKCGKGKPKKSKKSLDNKVVR